MIEKCENCHREPCVCPEIKAAAIADRRRIAAEFEEAVRRRESFEAALSNLDDGLLPPEKESQ